ncbi:MAG: hypothetical protein K0Q79_3570 [Flavipsychrobacter sp.]|jgi:hypothetical protein|nr:hypothetical protein [Flavipsychrobacter sp.]
MNRIFFILLFFPCISNAQIITTIAGSGATTSSTGDGGPATAATMGRLFGLARDVSGNIYISDYTNGRIRKVNTSGVITTFAGNGSGSSSGDGGPATAAGLDGPSELGLYGSNLYIAEHDASRVRKINLITGIITTYAGTGTNGYSGDGGPATAAQISQPYGIGVDNAGNVYIPDQHTHRMRKVDTFGIITTFAGTGVAGYSGDGGPATAANIHLADDIKCDTAGNLYFCDFLNNAVRKISLSGIITTIAGTGVVGYSGDGGPATAAQLHGPCAVIPDLYGNIYIGDADNHRLRMINPAGVISTVAGTGTMGFSGDGGYAVLAQVNRPNDMIFDAAGDLYFCDLDNHRVRKISPPPGDVPYLSVPTPTQPQLTLYPNPAGELLTIKFSAIINTVTIINIDGKVVYSSIHNSAEVWVNTVDLPTGIYFVNTNGKETREFIKK